MTNEHVAQILRNYEGKFADDKQNVIKSKLQNVQDDRFDELMSVKLTQPTAVLIVSIFLGFLGIDRFMVKSAGLGVLKLLTGGLFGIMWLIDIFVTYKKAKEINYNKFALSI